MYKGTHEKGPGDVFSAVIKNYNEQKSCVHKIEIDEEEKINSMQQYQAL